MVTPEPEAVVFGPHDATNVDMIGLFQIATRLQATCEELTAFTTMVAPNTGGPNTKFPGIPQATSELLEYVDQLSRNIGDVVQMYKDTDAEQAALMTQLHHTVGQTTIVGIAQP